ncbi:unnamed protein product [Rotaria magnacalcarata]|uniref:Uncharacterized protein n=2 Tax=Rotaria magnacalcarata TaxID=392030 RepID=A0A816NY65_9BILA|nr:unnamed protein product [Rotaria magnacalcarata]CAF3871061.1 unnamed protein product [Rotaria magnacalcarata]CAF4157190.1 unnamed protein product [Rotaria magnacalcarata]
MGNDQSSSQQGSSNSKPNCPICGGHRNVRHAVSLDTDGYSRASSGGYIGSMTNELVVKDGLEEDAYIKQTIIKLSEIATLAHSSTIFAEKLETIG